jgi:hypothetical protein
MPGVESRYFLRSTGQSQINASEQALRELQLLNGSDPCSQSSSFTLLPFSDNFIWNALFFYLADQIAEITTTITYYMGGIDFVTSDIYYWNFDDDNEYEDIDGF